MSNPINPTNMNMLSPTWLPPQTHLHYQALYRGIYEYLRAPPSPVYHERANAYLVDLIANYHRPSISQAHPLQYHRILWTRAWLHALHQDLLVDYQSDAETVVNDSLD